jgi:hypothetical protein
MNVNEVGSRLRLTLSMSCRRTGARRCWSPRSVRRVGYDKASAIAHKAGDQGTSLPEAALALGVSAADFDRIVGPETMVGNPRRDPGLEHSGTRRR